MAEEMTGREIRDALKERMVPILLDRSVKAHWIAWRLFWKYGVVSFLCGEKKSLFTELDPVCRFLRLEGREARLAAEQLTDFVDTFGDCLFFLVPLCERDHAFVSSYASLLESHLIVAEPKALLSEMPFASCH